MGDAALEVLKIEDVCMSFDRDNSRKSRNINSTGSRESRNLNNGGSRESRNLNSAGSRKSRKLSRAGNGRSLSRESNGRGEKDRLLVLEKINLPVNKGEFLAVVGPSGCGKSTLLGIIGGFIRPDSGRVFFDGREVDGPDADRILVFQDDNQLFPWKTLLQNVLFPLKVKNSELSRAEMEGAARKYLELVQLEGFLDYYPHQLSGGMKQRGALARALVTEPEIMLMDEPFGSLDSQTRTALQAMLLGIWQETGCTVVFVTHDISEAVFLADRIVVMGTNPGRIKKIIVNRLKRPRKVSDPAFSSLYDEVYELLAQ